MKILVTVLLISSFVCPSIDFQEEGPEFVCMMMHRASNSCHYNFTKSGEKFRYTDVGCRYKSKKDELIRKVSDGSLALAKDWKIECPKPKEPVKKPASQGF